MPEWLHPLGNLILGPVVVGVAIFAARVQKRLDEVQAARVEDAKKVTSTLLDLTERWHGVIGELSQTVRELRAALHGRQQQ